MPGTMTYTPIPTSPKAAANAATFNSRYTELATAGTNHFNGASARHILAEIDSPILDDTAQSVTLGTGATDLNTRSLQFLAMIGKIIGGAVGTNGFARALTITPGISDLYSLTTVLQTRNAAAVPDSLALRDHGGDLYSHSFIASGALYGAGAVQITDGSTGKVLAAALSTVGILQGGTGATSAGGARTALGVPANDGTGATGTWPIAISGAAGSVPAAGVTGTITGSQTDSTIAKTANVPTNGGTGATGTWPISITGAALTYNDRTIAFAKLVDLAPSGTGTTLVVTVQGGAYLSVVSSTIVQRIFAGGTIVLVPSSSNSQWQSIYLDNAGALQVNPGALGGIKDTAPLPSGGYAIGWAFLPQNAVAVYSSQAEWQAAGSPANKGYLVPQNANGGAAGSGAGGTSGAAITSPFAIWGSNGGLGLSANAQGIDAVLTGTTAAGGALTVNGVRLDQLRIKESMLADDYRLASLEDYLSVSMSGNIDGAVSTVGGAVSLRVPTGQPPLTFKLPGYGRKQLTWQMGTITTNTVSVVGSYILVADLNGGPAVPVSIALQTNINAGQVAIRELGFDGSAFSIPLSYDRTKPLLNGLSYTPTYNDLLYPNQPAALTGIVTTGTQTIFAGGPLSFNLPAGTWMARCRGQALINTLGAVGGTTNNLLLYVMQSSGVGVPVNNAGVGTGQRTQLNANTSADPIYCRATFRNLSGYQNFNLAYLYQFTGTAPGTINLLSPILEVDITRQS